MLLEILSVDVPSEASVGETVNVNVFAYNKGSSRIFAIVTARCNTTDFSTVSAWVNANSQRAFGFQFVMPNGDVTIWCWLWSWNFGTGAWNTSPDDAYGPVTVSLAGGGGPGVEASITDIRVNDLPKPISLNIGDEFRVQFKGKNTSSSNISLKSSIVIKNPSGRVEYQGGDTEYPMWTGPNGTQQFIYPKTTPLLEPKVLADVSGQWKADIYLYDHGTGEELDRELGVVIANVAEVEETYSVVIQSPQIRECNGLWKDLTQNPELTAGKDIQVKFVAKNTGTASVNIWGVVEVSSPSGPTFTEEDDREGALGVGSTHTFTFPWTGMCKIGAINTAGSYKVSMGIDIVIGGARQTIDTKEYNFTVSGGGGEAGFEGYMEAIYVDQTGLVGGEQPVPVAGISGKGARVSFHGVVKGAVSHVLCAKLWIYGPAPVLSQQEGITHGPQKYYYEDCATLATMVPAPTLPGYYHPFVFPSATVPPGGSWFQVDEDGQWTLKARLEDESGRLVEEREAILFSSATEEPAGMWDIMSSILPLMMIMMMMSMMMPMMKGFGEGVEEE